MSYRSLNTVDAHAYRGLVADLDNSNSYIPSLDGLRAISILIVMCSHFVTNTIPGGLGVYVFFVISGFLISRQFFFEYGRTNKIEVKHFYIRRIFRLYPVALFYTAVVVVAYLVSGSPIDWMQPLSAIFYFSNYLYAELLMHQSGSEMMPFSIFWSLSVEEHFYIVFPAMFIFLSGDAKRVLLLVIGILFAALALRGLAVLLNPEVMGSRYIYYRSEFRMDSIAFGVGIAAMCATSAGRGWLQILASKTTLVVSLALILFCLIYREPYFRETIRYTLLGFGVSGAVVFALFSQRAHFAQVILNAPGLVYVGKLSYSLYLWHLLAPGIISFFTDSLGGVPLIAAKFILAFAMSAASYHLLEVPFQNLRKRIHRGASAKMA